MARYSRKAFLFAICWSSIGLAFQPPVKIEPRLRPVPATEPGVDLPQSHLRVDSSLVLVPVHVTNPLGASVTTLGKDNFRIFEDGQEQKVTLFARDDAPVSIGVVFDTSGSMHNKMQKSLEAVSAFIKTANVEDEFFLVEFNERPKLTVPFTGDSDALYRRISRTRPMGRTSLLDAIHVSLEHMKNARHLRKALVIVSDGGDNRSRNTPRQIETELLESDVQVYAMGIFDPDDSKRSTPEERNGPLLLDEMTEQTGGHHHRVDDLNDLPDIAARIGNELRDQYVLGYSPSNDERNGRYRQVRVKLAAPENMPRLRTYYRQGYYAPLQ